MYRYLARHLMAPALDFFRGTQAMKLLRELEESQWRSPHQILELQNHRLRTLIKYAYENVPYYHRIFDERGLGTGDIEGSHDLVKLPILTKRLIRSNIYEITAQSFPVEERVQLATGGSTGQPLLFYTSWVDHTDLCIAARQRAHSGVGFELGDKSVSIRNSQPYKSRAGRFWQTPVSFFRRTLSIDVRETPADIARKLEAFHPRFITGYPSMIEQVARFIKITGNLRIAPRAIITGAEQLHDYQRELFRETFGCDTFDFYGSHEEHLIAFECREHSGYHIAAENVIVEIVDAEGKTIPSGKVGRILITNLHNYAMPFIRYDIGDLGVASDSSCPCGRGLPLLASINGRDVERILTKSRGEIPGIRIWEPFRLLASKGVEQFQVVQETHEKVVIKMVLDKEVTQEQIDRMNNQIVTEYKSILGEDMEITTEFVNQIVIGPTGKIRVIMSNLIPGNS